MIITLLLQYLLFLQYVFTLNAREMANAIGHEKNILEIQKPVEVLNYT